MHLLFQIALSLILLLPSGFNQTSETAIADCNYTLTEALEGKEIPASVKNPLQIINVTYYSFDEKLHKGQLVVHKDIVKDIIEIFALIKEKKFPVDKVIPAVKYNWDDDKSMLDNNTSAFNYRKVKGFGKLSAHSTGKAIDINPFLNPQVRKDKIFPDGAGYNKEAPGTLTAGSFIVKEFIKRGWSWGGNWRSTKDYQHFEKK